MVTRSSDLPLTAWRRTLRQPPERVLEGSVLVGDRKEPLVGNGDDGVEFPSFRRPSSAASSWRLRRQKAWWTTVAHDAALRRPWPPWRRPGPRLAGAAAFRRSRRPCQRRAWPLSGAPCESGVVPTSGLVASRPFVGIRRAATLVLARDFSSPGCRCWRRGAYSSNRFLLWCSRRSRRSHHAYDLYLGSAVKALSSQ